MKSQPSLANIDRIPSVELQTLRLYSNGLQLGTSAFPALLSLTVNASGDLETETMQKLLDPLHFPSLRALAFKPISTSSFLDILSHPPCAPLFDQLDTFFVGVEALSPSLIIGHQLLLEKTLVSIGTALARSWLSQALGIQHVRLRRSDFLPFAKLLREADDCNLRSLYLARPNPNDLISDPIFASEYEALLSVCRDRKTEVIFEVQGELSDYIPVVSAEFWRRQRALRRSG